VSPHYNAHRTVNVHSSEMINRIFDARVRSSRFASFGTALAAMTVAATTRHGSTEPRSPAMTGQACTEVPTAAGPAFLARRDGDTVAS
jgi:hypothetical protein